MFEFLKKVLVGENGEKKVTDENKFKLQVSVCLLLVDIAKIDGNFSDTEKEYIKNLLINDFEVGENDVQPMIARSEEVLKRDDSIYDYTQIINKSFDNNEKYKLLKNLWRLVFVDGNKDMFEEHLVKKIGGLLDLDNRDVIAARLSVKEELKL